VSLWYPLPPSAVSRCTVVEEHSDKFLQHDNEITIYVLNGKTNVPEELLINYDKERLYVVVNFPRTTDDRTRIADMCGVSSERVYFVDCVRALADVVLKTGTPEGETVPCLTPSQFGGELPRLERALQLAAQRMVNAESAHAVLDGVHDMVRTLEDSMRLVQQQINALRTVAVECLAVTPDVGASAPCVTSKPVQEKEDEMRIQRLSELTRTDIEKCPQSSTFPLKPSQEPQTAFLSLPKSEMIPTGRVGVSAPPNPSMTDQPHDRKLEPHVHTTPSQCYTTNDTQRLSHITPMAKEGDTAWRKQDSYSPHKHLPYTPPKSSYVPSSNTWASKVRESYHALYTEKREESNDVKGNDARGELDRRPKDKTGYVPRAVKEEHDAWHKAHYVPHETSWSPNKSQEWKSDAKDGWTPPQKQSAWMQSDWKPPAQMGIGTGDEVSEGLC